MFDEFLQHENQRLKLPGLAVAISNGEQEVYSSGLGYCDPRGSEPVTPDTLFGVASVTKLLTTIEVLLLAEQGLLDIDDAVARHFPELQIARHSTMQLRHLLSHSAGFPGLDSRFKAAELAIESDQTGHGTRQDLSGPIAVDPTVSQVSIGNANELVNYINGLDLQPLAQPGKQLNYSNEGFCLLGGIIEKIRNASYADAVNTSILQPLQLNRSAIGGKKLASMGNVAYPLIRDGNAFVSGQVWEAPLFFPAGGLVASARDITRLISEVFLTTRLLSERSQQLLASKIMPVASRPHENFGNDCGYSLGLEFRRLDESNTVLWHTGQRPGVSSFVAWHIEHRIAVSVLSHIADAPVAGIGFELMAKLTGRDDVAWPPGQPPKQPPKQISVDATDTACFEGRYASPEGFDYQVQSDARGCKLHSNHLADPNREQQVCEFVFLDENSGIVGEQTFRFLAASGCAADSSLPADALAIDLRVLQRCE